MIRASLILNVQSIDNWRDIASKNSYESKRDIWLSTNPCAIASTEHWLHFIWPMYIAGCWMTRCWSVDVWGCLKIVLLFLLWIQTSTTHCRTFMYPSIVSYFALLLCFYTGLFLRRKMCVVVVFTTFLPAPFRLLLLFLQLGPSLIWCIWKLRKLSSRQYIFRKQERQS